MENVSMKSQIYFSGPPCYRRGLDQDAWALMDENHALTIDDYSSPELDKLVLGRTTQVTWSKIIGGGRGNMTIIEPDQGTVARSL